MKIENGRDSIDIKFEFENETSLPSYGDARVTVAVSSNGYSGSSAAWLSSEEIEKFSLALIKLENDRKGEAIIRSMSPGELKLKIYATNSRGHMAISGLIGEPVQSGIDDVAHSLKFGFSFEPSFLVELINLPWVQKCITKRCS